MNEQQLAQKITMLEEVAKANPGTDMASLVIKELETANQINKTSNHRIPYLVSIMVPPLGLVYAAKLYFSDNEEDKFAAYVCIGLTIAAILAIYLTTRIIGSVSNFSPAQLQQINPQDVQELYR